MKRRSAIKICEKAHQGQQSTAVDHASIKGCLLVPVRHVEQQHLVTACPMNMLANMFALLRFLRCRSQRPTIVDT